MGSERARFHKIRRMGPGGFHTCSYAQIYVRSQIYYGIKDRAALIIQVYQMRLEYPAESLFGIEFAMQDQETWYIIRIAKIK